MNSFVGHQGVVRCVAISPDGKLAATGGDDETVKLWNMSDGSLKQDFKRGLTSGAGGISGVGPGPKWTVAFSPTGDRIASSGNSNWIVVRNLQTGEADLLSSGPHATGVTCVAFSPVPNEFLATGDTNAVLYQNQQLNLGSRLLQFTGHTAEVTAAAFVSRGNFLVTSSLDGTLRLWNRGLSLGHQLGDRSSPAGYFDIDISHDCQMAVACEKGGTLEIFDLATTRRIRSFPIDSREARFLPDGRQVIAASNRDPSRLVFCDLATGTSEAVESGHGGVEVSPIQGQGHAIALRPTDICGLAVSPDGKLAATAAADRTIKLWDLKSRTALRTLRGHELAVDAVAFSPDGRTLVSGSDDATARLWDVQSGNELRQFKTHPGPVNCVAFSADGQKAVTGCDDRLVRVWDVFTGRQLLTLHGANFAVTAVSYSADGKLIIAGMRFYGFIEVWDAETGRPLRPIFDGDLQGANLARSLDGNWIAGCSELVPTPRLLYVGRPSHLLALADQLQEAARRIVLDPDDSNALRIHGEWYAICGQFDWAANALFKAEEAGADVSPLLSARCWWQSDGSDRITSLKLAERDYLRAIQRHEASETYLKRCVETVRTEQKEAGTSDHDWFLQKIAPLFAAGQNREAFDACLLRVRLLPRSYEARYCCACSAARSGLKDTAISSLATAIQLGFAEANRMEQDENLGAIRDDPQFKELLAEVKAESSDSIGPSRSRRDRPRGMTGRTGFPELFVIK